MIGILPGPPKRKKHKLSRPPPLRPPAQVVHPSQNLLRYTRSGRRTAELEILCLTLWLAGKSQFKSHKTIPLQGERDSKPYVHFSSHKSNTYLWSPMEIPPAPSPNSIRWGSQSNPVAIFLWIRFFGVGKPWGKQPPDFF